MPILCSYKTYRHAVLALTVMLPMNAYASVREGMLECKIITDNSSTLIQNQKLQCVFQATKAGAAPVGYLATISKATPNTKINGKLNHTWSVEYDANTVIDLAPGTLNGQYIASNSGAKVIGNPLVSGKFSLQSLPSQNLKQSGWESGVEAIILKATH